MLRWMALSDLHLRRYNDPKRAQDLVDFFDFLFFTVNQYRVKCIVFGGDWYNSKAYLHASLCNLSYNALTTLSGSCRMIFVGGNHDMLYPDQAETTLRPFTAFGQVIETPMCVKVDNITFNCIPFFNYKNTLKEVHPEADVLVTHAELDGMRANASYLLKGTTKADDLLTGKESIVLTGHAHWPQKLGRVQCIGSPYEIDFSDAGSDPRGLWIFDDTELFKFVPTTLPRHFIVDYKVTHKLPYGENYIRVINVPQDKVEEVLQLSNLCGARECSVTPLAVKTVAPDTEEYSFERSIDEFVEKSAPDNLDKSELRELGRKYLVK
jgi:Calcineurin-like phosphoesterase